MNKSYQIEYQEKCSSVESFLGQLFQEETSYKVLLNAMRYSLLAGGKRIRPVLCMAFCEAAGGTMEAALPVACAVELIHTYSLIHDDLPCMDNDDYRRGKPTCHKVYGENIATLAGDALLTAAFSLISEANSEPKKLLKCTGILASAAGEHGMVAGQVMDLQAEGKVISEADLQQIHKRKTGDMIRAACQLGVVIGGGSEEQLLAAEQFAYSLGLAFQVRDDMLDEIGQQDELGKPIGSDQSNGKFTYVNLLGIERCQELVEKETDSAISSLRSAFQDYHFLETLARSLTTRYK